MHLTDNDLKAILRSVSRIACVGVSTNVVRPSYYVARYLELKGYDVVPVNPVHVGKTLLGREVLPDLPSAPSPIDMVDVFRRSEHVPDVVDDVLALPILPKVLWLQIGVRHDNAARRARAAGLTVIQDRCPKIEYQRLFGELRMGGFATGLISSRL